MNKRRFLEMSEELERKIVELAQTIKRLEIENVEFDYYDENANENFKVSISEFKEFWEVVHTCDGYTNVSSSKMDIYQMKFNEDKLTYKYSEED